VSKKFSIFEISPEAPEESIAKIFLNNLLLAHCI
jgi:hypothetical protein